MESLGETIRREEMFLIACHGVQAERVRASLEAHKAMRDE